MIKALLVRMRVCRVALNLRQFSDLKGIIH